MAISSDRRRSPERRDQILDEAQALFLAHGLDAVTTRQIARAVGISQPSLYAHFPTRDAIAMEICLRAFERLRATLEQVEDDVQGWERVRALGHAYIRFGLDHPSAYRVAFMIDMLDAHGAAKAQVLGAGIAAFAILRRAVAEAGGEEQADITAQSVWASIHGLASLFIARPEFPFADRALLTDRHLDHILTGCGVRPRLR